MPTATSSRKATGTKKPLAPLVPSSSVHLSTGTSSVFLLVTQPSTQPRTHQADYEAEHELEVAHLIENSRFRDQNTSSCALCSDCTSNGKHQSLITGGILIFIWFAMCRSWFWYRQQEVRHGAWYMVHGHLESEEIHAV